jgi:hypothetical protein
LQEKSHTQETLKGFLRWAQNEFGLRIKKIRSDNGTDSRTLKSKASLRRRASSMSSLLPTRIGVHSGRPARPGPSPKRPVLFEFRAGPARLNFGPCRAGPWASPSAHGPARNCLNVPGLFRAARNYKSPKFIFWPEIHIRARNSVFGPKFSFCPEIHIRALNSKK